MSKYEITKATADTEKNRIRCWLCNRWVRQDLTVMRMFNGIVEPICSSCNNQLNNIDETEEMERSVYEQMQKAKKS